MKNYDGFTNLYSVKKALRFKAIPSDATYRHLQEMKRLEKEEELNEELKTLAEILDKKYRPEIEKVLTSTKLPNLEEYFTLFSLPERDEKEVKRMETIEEEMKKTIADAMKKSKALEELTKVKDLKKVLLSYLTDEEKALAEPIIDFVALLDPFFKTRKTIFYNRIPTRIVEDNLPIFLSNINTFYLAKEQLPERDFEYLNKELCGNFNINDVFSTDFYANATSQPGIDFYNLIIGGYTTEDGKKIQGLNEKINLFNAKNAADNKNAAKKNQTIIRKVPKATELKKQILGDKTSFSFIDDAFQDAETLFESVQNIYTTESGVLDIVNGAEKLFDNFETFDMSGIFVGKNFVSNLSHETLKNWVGLKEGWLNKYEEEHPIGKKSQENYDDNNDKVYRNTESFSIALLQEAAERYAAGKENTNTPDLARFYKANTKSLCESIRQTYAELKPILLMSKSANYNFQKDEKTIEVLKKAMDEVKKLEAEFRGLNGNGKEPGRDEAFYGDLNALFAKLKIFDAIYNRTRNFVTKKPYSDKKIPLNFDNAMLFGGWANTKIEDYRNILLRKDGTYYIAIFTSRKAAKGFVDLPPAAEGEEFYERLDTNKTNDPNKALPKALKAKSNKEMLHMTDEELSFMESAPFAKSHPDFSEENLHKAIELYKEKIPKYECWNHFEFHFRPTNEYTDIGEFYNDVKRDGYYHKFVTVSAKVIDTLTDSGDIYLFRLYTKDFNPNSHGKKDPNTIYFDALFSKENEENFDYRILGGAKMFYRKASLPKKVTHPANEKIRNKNSLNEKAYSKFSYDLYKDKRYMSDSFEVHLLIEACAAAGRLGSLNEKVRDSIKADNNNYILGISRGEKTLISACVIDEEGNIVEQKSFNQISNITPDNAEYVTDYKTKLDERENERKQARLSWKTIESIRQLKEGYISQVVHQIVEMARKYSAIIAIEDLSGDFKQTRAAIEKNVYQKFEDALIKKLNFWVRKGEDPMKMGGAFKPYQLTRPFDPTEDKYGQDGIVFYVSPSYTSAIDPTTGFAPLLKISYKTVGQTKDFLSKFDDIRFNKKEGYFEFVTDYAKFGIEKDYQKKWTICTANNRTRMKKNPQTSVWEAEDIVLTQEFIDLFEKYGFDYKSATLKDDILQNGNYKFYIEFINLLRLTMQMKNTEVKDKKSEDKPNRDYIISPVKNKNHTFFDSRDCRNNGITRLPQDAAANSAYNIARKALYSIKKIKADSDTTKTNAYEWFGFAQTGNYLPELSQFGETKKGSKKGNKGKGSKK